jgi:tetratricopeptide (TPR) repeat protein
MIKEINSENNQSPFFNLLSDAESIQVREIVPTTQTSITQSVEQAVKNFDQSENLSEMRSFLVTIKKSPLPTAEPKVVPTQEERELKSALSKAELLLKNEDYILSRNLYSFVLSKDIKNQIGLRGLGTCLFNLGDTAAAKKCFNALIEVHKSAEGHALLGFCYVKENNDLAAFDSFSQVKKPDFLPLELKFNFFKEFGNCLTRLERFNEASENYHQALALNPRSHVILINLGTLEIQRKRLEKATRYFQQAIDFCPTAAKAFCGIGIIAQMSSETEIAQVYFNKTLDVDCINSVALQQLYALAETDSQWRAVRLRLVQSLIREPGNQDHRFLLAATLLKQNDWIGCESELNIILAKSPEHQKAKSLKTELSLHRHRQGGYLP